MNLGMRSGNNRLPVVQTIAAAYNFAFGQLGTIIGLIWLPMVIWAIGDYFVTAYYYTALPDALSSGNAMAASQASFAMIGWRVASLLLWSIMYVAVVRQALGLRDGPARIHFALGAAEWRLFAGMLGLFAVILLFVIAYVAAVQALAAALGGAAAPQGALDAAMVLGACLLLYALVRFSYLLIPTSVAEGKVGLGESWQLAAGNFWRIVLVLLAVLLPIAIVTGLAELALLGPEAIRATFPSADAAQQMQAATAQMRLMAAKLPMLYGINLFLAPFLTGLTAGVSAAGYRALKGTPAR